MRRHANEQRLEALESDFRPRRIAVLRECASERYGLFGQNNHGELARYYVCTEADDLKQTAKQISALRSEFGQRNPHFHHISRILLDAGPERKRRGKTRSAVFD